jgi:hypothetical protein
MFTAQLEQCLIQRTEVPACTFLKFSVTKVTPQVALRESQENAGGAGVRSFALQRGPNVVDQDRVVVWKLAVNLVASVHRFFLV